MYRTIDTSIWNDPRIRRLIDPLTKLLAVYVFSNDRAHVTGLYFFSLALAADELGVDITKIKKPFKFLCESGFVKWDEERRVIFVKNMWKRQPHAGIHLNRLQDHFKTLNNTPLVADFLSKYPWLKPHVTDLSLICTNMNESAPQEIEQEQEKEQNSSPTPPPEEGSKKQLRLPLVKKKEELAKILAAYDIEPLRKEFEPQGLDVDRWWVKTQDYVLNGSAKKPYPNPENWRDWNKAFRNSCTGAIERELFQRKAAEENEASEPNHPLWPEVKAFLKTDLARWQDLRAEARPYARKKSQCGEFREPPESLIAEYMCKIYEAEKARAP